MAFVTNTLAVGAVVGTGAAINVSIGWVPDFVVVVNQTDGDKFHMGFCGRLGRRVVFTSGGTAEVTAGSTLRGATATGVTAIVKEVLLTSGTWAGGDAAGSFLFDIEDAVGGNFGSENVDLWQNGAVVQTNVATVVAAIEDTIDSDTEIAAATGNASITSYVGTTALAKGFTLGSTVSESAKVLRYVAMRGV